MDPEALLQQIPSFIRTGADTANEARSREAFHEAGDRLSDYWDWRGRDGFEPKDGDARARRLGEELSAAWEKRDEEEHRERAVHADYWANHPACLKSRLLPPESR